MRYINLKSLRAISACTLLLLSALPSYSQNQEESLHESDNNTDQGSRFHGWTEEDYRAYEDSIINAIFPMPELIESELPQSDGIEADQMPHEQSMDLYAATAYPPTSVDLDKNRSVGEIAIEPGVSRFGSRTYSVPLKLPPGMNALVPKLSLAYDSFRGTGHLGYGWTLDGLPLIERRGKDMYHDQRTQGILMDGSDSFWLDGQRLLEKSRDGLTVTYESETGHIMAVAHMLDDRRTAWFEVFYPNGNKGIFGYDYNDDPRLSYPMTRLTDAFGNNIHYIYSYHDFHYIPEEIMYNDCSVKFAYSHYRRDPMLNYSSNLRVFDDRLLESISIKKGTTSLGEYTLTYETRYEKSLLSRIDYSSGECKCNPLRFFHGRGSVAASYDMQEGKLLKAYKTENPRSVRVAMGRLDYYSGGEGLVTYPNACQYFQHHRDGSLFRHQENKFVNYYTGDEEILVYPSLTDKIVFESPSIKTGTGFVDLLCANISGNQEERIVRVNNYVRDGLDMLDFTVFRASEIYGLTQTEKRSYSFGTVHTDYSGNRSIQPKFFYTGDFNGDGRDEILSIAAHEPLNDTDLPSVVRLFDIQNDKLLYSGLMLQHRVTFVGTLMDDADRAARESDRILVIDYDGDGKSDICHIHTGGMTVYTFEDSGSGLSPRRVATYAPINLAWIGDRQVHTGDFNGDGLTDIMVSPVPDTADDREWTFFNSMGKGQFDRSVFTLVTAKKDASTGFIMQDVNGDGCTDIVNYDALNFYTYLARNNTMTASVHDVRLPGKGFVIVPIRQSSANTFQLVSCLHGSKIYRYRFSRDENLECMVTAMATSLGVVQHNTYESLDWRGRTNGFYTCDRDNIFPYVHMLEPMCCLTSSTLYIDGTAHGTERWAYRNGMLHRQGKGFCGFEQIDYTDRRLGSTTTQYDPKRFGVMTMERSGERSRACEYSVTTPYGKPANVNMTGETVQDLLTGFSTRTSYLYDYYGNLIYINSSTSDGFSKRMSATYSNNAAVGEGYMLGLLTSACTTEANENCSLIKEVSVSEYHKGLPVSVCESSNGQKERTTTYSYDSKGNVTLKSVTPFSSATSRDTTYQYNSWGALCKVIADGRTLAEMTYDARGDNSKRTDLRGCKTAYTYDGLHRLVKTVFPDGSVRSTTYSWTTDGNGLFAILDHTTGRQPEREVYNPLSNKIRTSRLGIDGRWRHIDMEYSMVGECVSISLPFYDTPAGRSVCEYDRHGRQTNALEACGRETVTTYSGSSVTETTNGVSVKRTYDSAGHLVEVEDANGTVNYRLRPDGLPLSVTAADVTTRLEYDAFGRRTSMSDPSAGTTDWRYDDCGRLASETNAKGQSTEYSYDSRDRLVGKSCPEFTAAYGYSDYDDLQWVKLDGRMSRSFSYDAFGRTVMEWESPREEVWLRKQISYSGTNISRIAYSSDLGTLGEESRVYTNGVLTGARFGQEQVFSLDKENEYGMPVEVHTTRLLRKYSYDIFGNPTQRYAHGNGRVWQDQGYEIDPLSGNLLSRSDNTRRLSESFSYDDFDRLTSYGDVTISYDHHGNIIGKSDVGLYRYEGTSPYAVTGIREAKGTVASMNQTIEYTSFNRPSLVSYRDIKLRNTYDDNGNKTSSVFSQGFLRVATFDYIGQIYDRENSAGQVSERLYLFGDRLNAPMVFLKTTATRGDELQGLHQILRDHLGSVTHVFDAAGHLKEELSYDPWGQLRDPATHLNYTADKQPRLFLRRGFGGHEYLPMQLVVDMGARLYDPAVGRFLSPDPLIQMPSNLQNFNRYSYTLNNPLRYTDPSGKFFVGTILTAIGNLFGNVIRHGLNTSEYSWRLTRNAWKIDRGMFTGSFPQVVNKWSYGFLNSLIGNLAAHGYNAAGKIGEITYMDGMLALPGATNLGAFTIAQYSFGPIEYSATWENHLFVHEYGHYIQSQFMGSLYIPVVGIPSLTSAGFMENVTGIDHNLRWFEVNASKLGAEYFDKHYGSGKSDYYKGSKNHFDKELFITHSDNPKNNNPISGAQYSIWEFIFSIF